MLMFLIASAALVFALLAWNGLGSLTREFKEFRKMTALQFEQLRAGLDTASEQGREKPEDAAMPDKPNKEPEKEAVIELGPTPAAPKSKAASRSAAAIKISSPVVATPEAPVEQKAVTPELKSQNWGAGPWDSKSTAEQSAPPPTPPPPPPKPAAPKRDVEQALASRWFVWVGGAAIALAGLLFVKYAHDNGLIPPILRVIFGLAVAAVLVWAGEKIRKARPSEVVDYVPAALSAAGLVIGFGVVYAAYALYDIISAGLCFPLLVLIGLAALWLSRRQGPLIAALGLVGSYAAPMLVPSDNPNAWGFFAYLFVIAVASFYELRSRPWWWLGYAAIAGATIWSFLWIGSGLFNNSQLLPTGLFALALGAAATLIPAGRKILGPDMGFLSVPEKLAPPMQIAICGMVAGTLIVSFLVLQSSHAIPALVLFAIAMAAITAFGFFRDGMVAAPLLAALLSFIVLMRWDGVGIHSLTLDMQGLWTTLPSADAPPRFRNAMLLAALAFTAVAFVASLRKNEIRPWTTLASVSAVLFIFGAWARADATLDWSHWTIIAVVAAVLLAVLAYLLRHRASEVSGEKGINALVAGFALLGLFALDRALDHVWLTLQIAVFATAIAMASRILPVRSVGIASAALASLVALRLFAGREFWSEPTDQLWGTHWVLYGYGVPAILFWFAARLLDPGKFARARISLEGISLGLLISLVSLELRILIGGGVEAHRMEFLEQASHVVAWLGGAYGLAYRQKIYSGFVAKWGTAALLAASSAVLVWLMIANPMVTGDALRGGVFFSPFWLAYAMPAVLLVLLARQLPGLDLAQVVRPVTALAVALTAFFVTLFVRRVFQGPLMDLEFTGFAEFAVMLVVWMAASIGVVLWHRKADGDVQRYADWTFLGLSGLGSLAALTVMNPMFTSQPINPNAVINPLWLGYFVPAAYAAWMARNHPLLKIWPRREIAGIAALVLALTFVTLMVKRFFQGPIVVLEMLSDVESYVISLVWLITSLLFFGLGIKLDRQNIRYGGLAVMVLTILKVFILDLAGLGGLWRIGSLLGLGLCLIGVGWLYTRYVHKGGVHAPITNPLTPP